MPDISYTPTTWADTPATSSALDAANLNNLESGVAAATAQANTALAAASGAALPHDLANFIGYSATITSVPAPPSTLGTGPFTAGQWWAASNGHIYRFDGATWLDDGSSSKFAVANGIATLGNGGRIPPVQLGTSNGDPSKFLNGNGDFVAVVAPGGGTGFSDFADVTAYFTVYGGAKDGSADCSAAFTAALAANDAIWAPAGQYKFDAPIATQTTKKMIIGSGYQATYFLTSKLFATNYPGVPLLTFLGSGHPSGDINILDTASNLTYAFTGGVNLITAAGNYTLCDGYAYPTGAEPVQADGTRYPGTWCTGAPFYATGNHTGGQKVVLNLGALTGSGSGSLIVEASSDRTFATDVQTIWTQAFTDANASSSFTFNSTFDSTPWLGRKFMRCRLNVTGTPSSWPITVVLNGDDYGPLQGVVLQGFMINANGAGDTNDFGRWNTSGLELDRCKMVTVRDVWFNKQQRGFVMREMYDSFLANLKTLKCGQSGFGQGAGEVQTITITATGGTLTFSDGTVTTAALAYNDTAANFQTQARTLTNGTKASVAKSGGVYTITYDPSVGNVPQVTVNTGGLSGGTATVATVSQGQLPGAVTGLSVHPAVSMLPYNEWSKGQTDNSTVVQWHFEDNKYTGLLVGRTTRRVRFFGCKWHGDLASSLIMTTAPSVRLETAYTNQFFGCAFNRAGASHVEIDQHNYSPVDSANGNVGSDRNNFTGCYFDSAQTNPNSPRGVYITATGGTYTLTLTIAGGGGGTTAPIAWNADAATVQAAIRAVTGLSLVTVTRPNQTANYLKVTVNPDVPNNVTFSINPASLTGGTGTLRNLAASVHIIAGVGNRFNGDTWSSNTANTNFAGLVDVQGAANPNNSDNRWDAGCEFHDIYDFKNVLTGTITQELAGPCAATWTNPTTGVTYTWDGTTLLARDQTLIYPAFSMDSTIVVKTGTKRFYVNEGWKILGVRASLGTQPTGSSVIVDVRKNGSSIFNATPANKPTIAVSTNTALSGTPDTTALSSGDYLTVDVNQIGSTVAGADLVVEVQLQRSS